MRRSAAERHRNSNTAKLRALLEDRAWHDAPECLAASSWRFGDCVYRIRRGHDKRPAWVIEAEELAEDSSLWRYRWTGEVDPNPPRTVSWHARALTAEADVARLGELVHELRAELERERRRGQLGLFETEVRP